MKAIITSGFILGLSSISLLAQPYVFDENGNGTKYVIHAPIPMPFEVAADPTGGITNSPVLIYQLNATVVSGDLALIEPGGTAVVDLLRFFTPAGSSRSEMIFYSQVGDVPQTLADVGIPYSANPLEITETSPQTVYIPFGPNAPGQGPETLPVGDFFSYTIITVVPEPSSKALLLVGLGLCLSVWICRRKVRAGI